MMISEYEWDFHLPWFVGCCLGAMIFVHSAVTSACLPEQLSGVLQLVCWSRFVNILAGERQIMTNVTRRDKSQRMRCILEKGSCVLWSYCSENRAFFQYALGCTAYATGAIYNLRTLVLCSACVSVWWISEIGCQHSATSRLDTYKLCPSQRSLRRMHMMLLTSLNPSGFFVVLTPLTTLIICSFNDSRFSAAN